MENKIYDLLIVGAGPGGMAAAIYAKRSNMNVAFIEKGAPGGKVVMTSVIENYPGFASITGYELSTKIYEQTKALDIPHIYGEVTSFDKKGDIFEIKTQQGEIHYSKTLILASGMTENKFGVPGEDKFYGKGLSYCAICDGSFYKDKVVAILGGGNSAMKEARFLAKIAKQVYVIHRFAEFEAQKFEVELTKKIPNIELRTTKQIETFNGDKKLESISYRDTTTNELITQEIDGAFSFIGYKPITEYVNPTYAELQHGFIVTDNLMHTKTDGLYAIGDVTIKPYRQIVIAESDGIIAALEAEKHVNHLNEK